ncbi:MAG: tryptophan--tRNA ligase [Candidatus Gottesmanbacteria bacterium]|nr:tryptophan--tRNA ligase [Candidatus Gottesmanbacteria bacterium]
MNLKDTIEKILNENKVDYKFIPLPEDLPFDVPSHAAFHHISLAQAMVTILYKTEKGIVAAVKCADTQIDQEKFKKLAVVKTLAFASKAELKTLGTEAGLVPYLGLAIPYFIDAKVLTIGKAYGIGGMRTLGMVMNALDMPKVNGGMVGDFAFNELKRVVQGKRLVSGITPSGDGSLHIGNYLGAVKQFIELAKTNECFLFVADLHALTTIQDRTQLQHNSETLILNELALLKGFLSEKEFGNLIFYRQSDIGLHPDLQTILNNVTPLGLIKRAHAYKDKLERNILEEDINLGLFNYPVLMAADILLYKPDLVPVGKDQKQHVEITRDIAERFNKIYPSTLLGTRKTAVFKLPEAYIPEEVGAVLGTDGKRKMSKSLGNIISIFDDEEKIRKQVMSTYTDPTRIHATDPGHTEGNMVFTYLDYFGQKTKNNELKEAYRKGQIADVEVKNYLYESLLKYFANARKAYKELAANPAAVKKILEDGAAKARIVAGETMREVREAVGLINQYSNTTNTTNKQILPILPIKTAKQLGNGENDGVITIEEFGRVELRVGKVVEATNKEGSEKLIRLVVDFGLKNKGDQGDGGDKGGKGDEKELRIIFTGVRGFGYTPEDFLNKQFFFITNLAPRKMMDEESQGMILAVDSKPGFPEDQSQALKTAKPLFVSAEGLPVGAKIR